MKWATLTAWWLLLLLQQSVSLRPLGCLLVRREYFKYSEVSHRQSVTSWPIGPMLQMLVELVGEVLDIPPDRLKMFLMREKS